MKQNPVEEKPPFFKSWKGMYWMVIGFLAFYVIALYIFTVAFA